MGDVKEQLGAKKMGQALVRSIIEREFHAGEKADHIPIFHFLRGVGGSWVPWRRSIASEQVHGGVGTQGAMLELQHASRGFRTFGVTLLLEVGKKEIPELFDARGV